MLPGCSLLAKSKQSLHSHSIPTPNLVYSCISNFGNVLHARRLNNYMSIGYGEDVNELFSQSSAILYSYTTTQLNFVTFAHVINCMFSLNKEDLTVN